jgi:hypothetical protein
MYWFVSCCECLLQRMLSTMTLTFHYTLYESRVEAGSNTSTVTLRVVGGDEKGMLESETVKYGHESHGTRTRK